MPRVLVFGAYIICFWVGENGEPVHVHVAEKRPSENATKIWLTSSGGCLLAHNRSKIPDRDLSNILELISLNHGYICDKMCIRDRQSPLVRQWAGADRARVLGPDAPLMGAHGLSATGDDPSGAGGANGLGAASVASDDRTLAAAAGAPSDPADLLLLGGRSASLLGGSGFAAPTSTGAVSYTHLDVYKRQAISCFIHGR